MSHEQNVDDGYNRCRSLSMYVKASPAISHRQHCSLRSRIVTVLAWTAKGPGFKTWFSHLSTVGKLYD